MRSAICEVAGDGTDDEQHKEIAANDQGNNTIFGKSTLLGCHIRYASLLFENQWYLVFFSLKDAFSKVKQDRGTKQQIMTEYEIIDIYPDLKQK